MDILEHPLLASLDRPLTSPLREANPLVSVELRNLPIQYSILISNQRSTCLVVRSHGILKFLAKNLYTSSSFKGMMDKISLNSLSTSIYPMLASGISINNLRKDLSVKYLDY